MGRSMPRAVPQLPASPSAALPPPPAIPPQVEPLQPLTTRQSPNPQSPSTSRTSGKKELQDRPSTRPRPAAAVATVLWDQSLPCTGCGPRQCRHCSRHGWRQHCHWSVREGAWHGTTGCRPITCTHLALHTVAGGVKRHHLPLHASHQEPADGSAATAWVGADAGGQQRLPGGGGGAQHQRRLPAGLLLLCMEGRAGVGCGCAGRGGKRRLLSVQQAMPSSGLPPSPEESTTRRAFAWLLAVVAGADAHVPEQQRAIWRSTDEQIAVSSK